MHSSINVVTTMTKRTKQLRPVDAAVQLLTVSLRFSVRSTRDATCPAIETAVHLIDFQIFGSFKGEIKVVWVNKKLPRVQQQINLRS